MRNSGDRIILLALALLFLVGGGLWFALEGGLGPVAARLPDWVGARARLTPLAPDGSFDAALTPLEAGQLSLRPAQLLLDEQGLVLVGTVFGRPGDERLAALRWRKDGSLDSDFGIQGLAAVDFAGGDQVARGGLRDAEGRLLLFGHGADGAVRRNMVVARLGRTGRLDERFDEDGRTALRFGDGVQSAEAAALDPAGRLLVGGFAEQEIAGERYREMAVARLLPDGGLDPSFGEGGQRRERVALASHDQRLGAVLALPKGGLVGAGSSAPALDQGTRTAILLQWLPAGLPDAGFGRRGLAEGMPSGEVQALAPVPGAEGLLAAGRTGEGMTEAFVLRLAANGQLDPSFGEGGRASLGSPGAGELRRLWLLDAGRRLLLVIHRDEALDCVVISADGRLAAAEAGMRRIEVAQGADVAVAWEQDLLYVAQLPAGDGGKLSLRRYPLPVD